MDWIQSINIRVPSTPLSTSCHHMSLEALMNTFSRRFAVDVRSSNSTKLFWVRICVLRSKNLHYAVRTAETQILYLGCSDETCYTASVFSPYWFVMENFPTREDGIRYQTWDVAVETDPNIWIPNRFFNDLVHSPSGSSSEYRLQIFWKHVQRYSMRE